MIAAKGAESKMKKERFTITGMTCSACSARVEQAVRKLAGTEEVSVNLLTNSLQLRYDEQQTNPAAIIAAIEAAGYGASVKGAESKQSASAAEEALEDHETPKLKRRLCWSLGLRCRRTSGAAA